MSAANIELPRLHSLDIKPHGSVKKILPSLLRHPDITHLDVTHTFAKAHQVLRALEAGAWPRLARLNIDMRVKADDVLLALSHQPRLLTYLQCHGVGQAQRKPLKHLLSFLRLHPALQSLELSYATLDLDEDAGHDKPFTHAQLHSLNIWTWSEDVFRAVHFPALTELSFQLHDSGPISLVAVAAACPAVRNFVLRARSAARSICEHAFADQLDSVFALLGRGNERWLPQHPFLSYPSALCF